MPVGERTILLAVLAPAVGPFRALAAMLVLGLVAATWTTAGRVGRTLLAASWAGVRPGGPVAARLAAQVDAAPVPVRTWPVHRRVGWLLPAAARVLEQSVAAVAVARLAPDALPALYAWLAVVVLAQYDVVYRQRLLGAVGTSGPLRWLGWPVRLTLVLLLAAAVAEHAAPVLLVGSAGLGVAALVSSVQVWRRSLPSTP
jgi:hypothetical protein